MISFDEITRENDPKYNINWSKEYISLRFRIRKKQILKKSKRNNIKKESWGLIKELGMEKCYMTFIEQVQKYLLCHLAKKNEYEYLTGA